jgi:hypothetical protein
MYIPHRCVVVAACTATLPTLMSKKETCREAIVAAAAAAVVGW